MQTIETITHIIQALSLLWLWSIARDSVNRYRAGKETSCPSPHRSP